MPLTYSIDFPKAVYIFADTETTDATPERGVCEIGWIVTDENFNILEEVESLIDPQRPIKASASGIHGLVDADVANSPTLEEFFSLDDEKCYGKKLPGNLVVLGHRIGFDTEVMAPYIDGDFVEACSLRWARRLYPNADDHKLQTLVYALNLPRSSGAHRVMADVYTAYHLAKHICEHTGMSLQQYAEASQENFLLTTMTFGKHKDDSFDNIPPSYLKWMLRELDLDRDMKFTVLSTLEKNK